MHHAHIIFKFLFKMIQLADRIKEIRKTANISQEVFAYSLGVSRAHISKIETGKAIPSKQLIKSICRGWNIREKWLEEGKGPADLLPPLNHEKIQQFKLDLEIAGYESAAQSFHFATISIKGALDFIRPIPGFKVKSVNQAAIKFLENKKIFQKNLNKLKKLFSKKDNKEFIQKPF